MVASGSLPRPSHAVPPDIGENSALSEDRVSASGGGSARDGALGGARHQAGVFVQRGARIWAIRRLIVTHACGDLLVGERNVETPRPNIARDIAPAPQGGD